jgi:hypothetical protein
MAWEKSDITRYCTCRWFERAAAEPGVPIEFNEQLNEYKLVDGSGGRMSLYFCPFCGCKAPESRSASMFTKITDAELGRLRNLTKEIKTLVDALRVLGRPDDDMEGGGSTIFPGSEGVPPSAIHYDRMLRYRRLSETIDVNIRVTASGDAQLLFSGKYVGPPHQDEPAL